MSHPDRTALVTGASGCLGTALARRLVSQGWVVRGLVRNPAKAEPLRAAGVEPVVGDVTDAAAVDRAVAGCSHVFHVAALYREARHGEGIFRAVNAEGTRHVLDAARRQGVVRTVHCSTVGVHGDIDRVQADETAPFKPHDAYQETKLEGEEIAWAAIRAGQPVSIFRPAAIYGPGDTRFLKLFRGIQNRTFRMFGSGRNAYHLVYIDDLVDGAILCGERPEAVGEAFILAGARWVEIDEMVASIAQAVGVAPPKLHLPLGPLLAAAKLCETLCRPLGIEPPLHTRRCDFFVMARGFRIDKARRLLGYAPKVDVAEGLARTAAWYAEAGLIRPIAARAAPGAELRPRADAVDG